MKVKVELVCKNENKLLGAFETEGPMDAETIARGAFPDRKRFPRPLDGAVMSCGGCQGVLLFRFAGGRTEIAVPGALEASS